MARIDRAQRAQELFAADNVFWSQGLTVAGMDEAGRGPLVGNVVAACVVMPRDGLIEWVDDSKKLSEGRREKVYEEIMRRALYVGVGQATPAEIDQMNILQATKKAMRRAKGVADAAGLTLGKAASLSTNGSGYSPVYDYAEDVAEDAGADNVAEAPVASIGSTIQSVPP